MIELDKGVGAIRCLAQLLASVLFILLGTGFAVAKSQPLHNLSFFPAQINIAAQHATTGFDTRAPPSTVQYVASTGGVTVMRGSALALHGQEAVSFGFGGGFDATNSRPTHLTCPHSSKAWTTSYGPTIGNKSTYRCCARRFDIDRKSNPTAVVGIPFGRSNAACR